MHYAKLMSLQSITLHCSIQCLFGSSNKNGNANLFKSCNFGLLQVNLYEMILKNF